MKSDKDLYRQLRALPCGNLWTDEVARFDAASPRERIARVAVIRAVGVVFSEQGTAEQRAQARAWLGRLLRDPEEKIRRYAMAALPKLGANTREESELLHGLKATRHDRERKSADRALRKVEANIARAERPSVVRLDRPVSQFERLRIHLRCRKGLEAIVRDEVEAAIAAGMPLRLIDADKGFVAVTPLAPFTLGDLCMLRCFGTISFVLGAVSPAPESIASAIASPLARHLLETLTDGSVRYRLEFVSRGHQRSAVQRVVGKATELCPELLNDPRRAPWSVDVHPLDRTRVSVELRPRLYPDPRFYYRKDDVEAASHPPLAACMAYLAGRVKDEIVWDPFCGSGQELIECALLGDVKCIIGTDTSPAAIDIARANVAAARLKSVQSKWSVCDFRDFAKVEGLGPGKVSLVITNPPMGRRIRIPDMKGFFGDFFGVAAAVLKPGGRLVFPNPLRLKPADPSLQLQYRQVVDLGGFDCQLEVYLKT
ncbi:MAG TPA: methyltransferase domain-containing protein [Kiritimatiellia bacterium]